MIVLTDCNGQTRATPTGAGDNLTVSESGQSEGSSEIELIKLNNCDGTANASQVAERGQSIVVEDVLQAGLSVEMINAAVAHHYGSGAESRRSIHLSAPPATNMEFQLAWSMSAVGGSVFRPDGSAGASYRLLRPVDVQIMSQRDIGCGVVVNESTVPADIEATREADRATRTAEEAVRETSDAATEAAAPTATMTAEVATETPPSSNDDTPPGTVLDVGETWRQGGIELTVTEMHMRPTEGVRFDMEIRNRRPDDVLIDFNDQNFAAMDDLGHTLRVTGDSRMSTGHGALGSSFVLGAGQVATLGGPYDYSPFVEANLVDMGIAEIIVTVSGISSIENARWRLPINR
jgi:hypothetical protein